MNEALLYRASLFALGCIFAFLGLSDLASGSVALTSVLFSISGVGLLLGVAYETFVAEDSAQSTPEGWRLWVMVAFTALAVVGFVWSALT